MDPAFFAALAAIVGVDLLLSGDNAIVIAMVCRKLPTAKRRVGMFMGTIVAIVLRVALASVAAALLSLPGVGIFGGIFLLWVSVTLIVASGDAGTERKHAASLLGAIVSIAVADIGMSTDNVAAVAALSHGDPWLLWIGIGISLPLVVAGSAAVSWLMDRAPSLIWVGSAVLAYVASGTVLADPLLPRTLVTPLLAAFWCVVGVWSTALIWMAIRVRSHEAQS